MVFWLTVAFPYGPLLGMLYHTHELSNYSIVGLVKRFCLIFGDITATKRKFKPDASFFRLTFGVT